VAIILIASALSAKLVTFDIIPVDNFYNHIWNQHILDVNILKYEGYQRGKKSSPTHPNTHPQNKTFVGFKKADIIG